MHKRFVGSHASVAVCERCGREFAPTGINRHTGFCKLVPPPIELAREWQSMTGRKSAQKLAEKYGVTPCNAFLTHLAEGKRQLGIVSLEVEKKEARLSLPAVPNSTRCKCGVVIPDTEKMCDACLGDNFSRYAVVKQSGKAVMQGNLRHVLAWLDKQAARYVVAGQKFTATAGRNEYVVVIL